MPDEYKLLSQVFELVTANENKQIIYYSRILIVFYLWSIGGQTYK